MRQLIELFPTARPSRVDDLERMVEAVEALPEPFTIKDVWRATNFEPGYSMAEQVVRTLLRYGLVIQVVPGPRRPIGYVRKAAS